MCKKYQTPCNCKPDLPVNCSLAHSCLPSADAGLSRALPVEPSWALHLHIGTVSRSDESRVWLYRAARRRTKGDTCIRKT